MRTTWGYLKDAAIALIVIVMVLATMSMLAGCDEVKDAQAAEAHRKETTEAAKQYRALEIKAHKMLSLEKIYAMRGDK